jgi:hypothetical protein
MNSESEGAITVAGTVFSCSDAEIVGSNPTQGMDVCVVLCVGSALATGWSLAYRLYKKDYEAEEETKAQ